MVRSQISRHPHRPGSRDQGHPRHLDHVDHAVHQSARLRPDRDDQTSPPTAQRSPGTTTRRQGPQDLPHLRWSGVRTGCLDPGHTAAFCAAFRLPQWAMMLEPIVRVVVTHCKRGCSLDVLQRFAGASTHGRDAATNQGDNRQGWLTGGVRLAVNGPGRHVHESPGPASR